MQRHLTFTRLLWTTLALLLPALTVAKGSAAKESPILEDGATPPAELVPFIPSSWVLRAHVRGDLNADGRADWVIVLEGDDPAKRVTQKWRTVNANPRRFVVLIRDAKQPQGYRQVGVSDRLIPPAADELPVGESALSCAEDPLQGLAIRDRVITVALTFWSGCGSNSTSEERYRFRMESPRAKEQDRVRLIGVERVVGSRAHGERTTISANLLTGKKQRTDITLVPETKRKTKVSAIDDLRPFYLEDVNKAGQCGAASAKPQDMPWCP